MDEARIASATELAEEEPTKKDWGLKWRSKRWWNRQGDEPHLMKLCADEYDREKSPTQYREWWSELMRGLQIELEMLQKAMEEPCSDPTEEMRRYQNGHRAVGTKEAVSLNTQVERFLDEYGKGDPKRAIDEAGRIVQQYNPGYERSKIPGITEDMAPSTRFQLIVGVHRFHEYFVPGGVIFRVRGFTEAAMGLGKVGDWRMEDGQAEGDLREEPYRVILPPQVRWEMEALQQMMERSVDRKIDYYMRRSSSGAAAESMTEGSRRMKSMKGFLKKCGSEKEAIDCAQGLVRLQGCWEQQSMLRRLRPEERWSNRYEIRPHVELVCCYYTPGATIFKLRTMGEGGSAHRGPLALGHRVSDVRFRMEMESLVATARTMGLELREESREEADRDGWPCPEK